MGRLFLTVLSVGGGVWMVVAAGILAASCLGECRSPLGWLGASALAAMCVSLAALWSMLRIAPASDMRTCAVEFLWNIATVTASAIGVPLMFYLVLVHGAMY